MNDQIDPVPAYNSGDITVPDDGAIYRPDVVGPFFAAIRAGDADLVTSLLDANPSLVSTPEILTHSPRPIYAATSKVHIGILPLYAATVAGNPYIVALLAQRGAPIDQLSPTGDYHGGEFLTHPPFYPRDGPVPIMRTPLMAAAASGSLPLVKLLFNDLKADDRIVAPDGAIALRLAILGNHREIVAILPACRRGGWRRFKHSQRKSMLRIREAGYAIYDFTRFFVWSVPKFFVWHVPKYFLWDIPKELLPSIKAAIRKIPRLPSMMYRLMKRSVGWLWKFILGLPEFTVTLAKQIWKTIKEIPPFCVKFAKGCWRLTKTLAQWIWKLVTKTIPQFLLGVGKFIVRKLAAAGEFLFQLLLDTVSFFHTLIIAIITRFKAVTLDDVIHALSILFVSVPKWIWKTITEVAIAIKKGTIWTLEQMGDLVHCLVWVIWTVVMWIPRHAGKIAVGVGEIAVAGAREVTWWINPKARVLS